MESQICSLRVLSPLWLTAGPPIAQIGQYLRKAPLSGGATRWAGSPGTSRCRLLGAAFSDSPAKDGRLVSGHTPYPNGERPSRATRPTPASWIGTPAVGRTSSCGPASARTAACAGTCRCVGSACAVALDEPSLAADRSRMNWSGQITHANNSRWWARCW